MGEAVPGDKGGYKLQYNVNHPGYFAVENDPDQQAEYLFRLMGFELCRIDVLRDDSVLYTANDKSSADSVLRKTLSNMGGFLLDYYEE